jgi:Kinesin protein 1B
MEKLENKLIDMREMYQEYKDRPDSLMVSSLCSSYWLTYSLTLY